MNMILVIFFILPIHGKKNKKEKEKLTVESLREALNDASLDSFNIDIDLIDLDEVIAGDTSDLIDQIDPSMFGIIESFGYSKERVSAMTIEELVELTEIAAPMVSGGGILGGMLGGGGTY